MERKNKNFIRPLWYVNREEKPGYPKNLLPSDDDSLKEYVKKLKKGKKLSQYPMDRWDNSWNFIDMTKRRRNYLDWRNTRDIHRDEELQDHIFRRIYEDNKDEWNAASIPERQALLKEIIRTVPGSERVNTTGWEQINF